MGLFRKAAPTPSALQMTAELAALHRQISEARAVLAGVQKKIAEAQSNHASQQASHSAIEHKASRRNAQLRETNARLIEAAMRNQTDTDSAMQALDALARSSQLDALTQLPNRSMMCDRFTQAIANAKRHNMRLAVLFLDVNDFKKINDTLGHAAGDEVLRKTARRLVSAVRDVDTVSRHGGDEFLILLHDVAQMADAVRVSDKVALTVADPMLVSNWELRLSVSIGIALYPEDGMEQELLIKHADAAMYQAKRLKAP